MVHVVGTRMIEQGMDRLSQGLFLEGAVQQIGHAHFCQSQPLCNKASCPHPRLCQIMVGTGIRRIPCPARESVVCGETLLEGRKTIVLHEVDIYVIADLINERGASSYSFACQETNHLRY